MTFRNAIPDDLKDIKQLYVSTIQTICKDDYDEEEIKQWCKDNQPYYKKHIPEVVEYFWKKVLR